MTAEPTRRLMLAGAVAITAAPVLAGSSPHLAQLGNRLDAAAWERYHAMLRFRAARKQIAAWGRSHPRPDYSGDGQALLGWLEGYRVAIVESGAQAAHGDYEATCRAHEAVAHHIAAVPVRTVADVQALGDMLEHQNDCDGIVRGAMLAGLASLQGGKVNA